MHSNKRLRSQKAKCKGMNVFHHPRRTLYTTRPKYLVSAKRLGVTNMFFHSSTETTSSKHDADAAKNMTDWSNSSMLNLPLLTNSSITAHSVGSIDFRIT